MNIFKKIFKCIKSLFKKDKPTTPTTPATNTPIEVLIENPDYSKYELIYEEMAETIDSKIWTVRRSGPSEWNKHAGLKPKLMENDKDGKYIRLACETSDKNEDGWMTSAISTKEAYGDGMFECKARFNSGKATWPAIWMTHPNGAANNYATYYEIDLSERYETRDNTETGYHHPQSMRGGGKYVQTVKVPIIRYGWNKFACTWDENSIDVYINNKKEFSIPNDGNVDHYPIEASSRTFQIILSMQYTNNYLNKPDLQELPLWMDIKDFKIYKLKKEA